MVISVPARLRLALLLALSPGLGACSDDDAVAHDPRPVDYGGACEQSDCAPEVPMTGSASPAFVELDIAMRQFIKFRCVGAGVLSVSLRGRRVYKRGFGRMAGPAAEDMPGCNDGELAGRDPFRPDAAFVQPDTPLLLGSVSKFLTAAMARRLVAARIEERGLQDMYPTPSHARLADPALGLLPAPVLDAIAGARCGPVAVDDGVTPECARTCGDTGVDVRWRDVTVGDLLAHTAGLPPVAAAWDRFVVPNFGALRGHASEADWAAEDLALQARYPAFVAGIAATRERLQSAFAPGERVYFVSRYDRRHTDPQLEWLGVYLTRCLARDPRGATDDGRFKGPYSNTHYSILDSLVAHLGPAGRYAAEVGHPEQHRDSQLHAFLAEHGVDGGVATAEGIFHAPLALGDPNIAHLPETRAWDGADYHTEEWDEKRPYCVWRGDRCDFSPWRSEPRTRPPWDFSSPRPLDPLRATRGLTIGTGALAAEAPALLRLVHLYALGDDDILQGRPRSGCGADCEFVMDKAGGLAGGRAYAISLSRGTYALDLPGLAPDGRLSEHGPRVRLAVEHPGDVDVVVMVGQSDDGKRAGTFEYSDLDEVVRYGLSRVDWSAVEAELAAQSTRVVGLAVDDAGDALYWCADDHLTIRRGDPAGLARGDLLARAPYRLPATRIGVDIVAVARALDRPGASVYAWYDDGHVGLGEPHDLRGEGRPEPYLPAPGRTYRDLAGVVVTPAGEAIALYHDGAASFGTVTDLAAYGTGRFLGGDPADIDALALAPDGRLYCLYRDGRVERLDLGAFVRDE